MRAFAHKETQSHKPVSSSPAPANVTNTESLEERSDVFAANRFAHDFSQVPIVSKAPLGLQAKLNISVPGDPYEQEADRIAEQVVNMLERTPQRADGISQAPTVTLRVSSTQPLIARQSLTGPSPTGPPTLFGNDTVEILARATIEITTWAQRHQRMLSQPSDEVVRMVRRQVSASGPLTDEEILRIIYPGRDALERLPEPPAPDRPALAESGPADVGTPLELPSPPRDFVGLTHTPGIAGALTRYSDVAGALERAVESLPMPAVLRRALRGMIRNRVREGTGRSLTGANTRTPPQVPVPPRSAPGRAPASGQVDRGAIRESPPATTASQSANSTEAAPVTQPGGTSTSGSGGPAADIRREYINVACEVIRGIRTAVEQGRTWEFENEFLLQGEEWLQVEQPTRVQERRQWLQQLVSELGSIMDELESGALTPTQPASRRSLARFHAARHPPRRQAWFNPIGGRTFDGVTVRDAPTRRYITDAPSAQTLQPAAFPTWWISGCDADRPAPSTEQPVTPITPGGIATGRQVVVGDSNRPAATAELLTPYASPVEPRPGRGDRTVTGQLPPPILGTPQQTDRGAIFEERSDRAGNCFIVVRGATVILPWTCPRSQSSGRTR